MNPLSRRTAFLGSLGLAFAGLVPAALAGDRKKVAVPAPEPLGGATDGSWASRQITFENCEIEYVYDAGTIEEAIAEGREIVGGRAALARPIRVRAGQRLVMRDCDVEYTGPCAIEMCDPSASVALERCSFERGRDSGDGSRLGVIAASFDGGAAARLI